MKRELRRHFPGEKRRRCANQKKKYGVLKKWAFCVSYLHIITEKKHNKKDSIPAKKLRHIIQRIDICIEPKIIIAKNSDGDENRTAKKNGRR